MNKNNPYPPTPHSRESPLARCDRSWKETLLRIYEPPAEIFSSEISIVRLGNCFQNMGKEM